MSLTPAPLVRADKGAIIAGSVMMALITIIVMRTGLVGLAQDRSTIDAWVLTGLLAGGGYGMIFWIGQDRLRRKALRSRLAYAGLGATAALLPFLATVGLISIRAAAEKGTISLLLLVPVVAGAMLGFLYHRRSGFEIEGDDPAALAATIGTGDDAIASTEKADYFSGPLVVRTSLGANAVASLLAGLFFSAAGFFSDLYDRGPLLEYAATQTPGLVALRAAIGAAVPIGCLLGVAHGVLRAGGRTTFGDYALAGLVGPALLGLFFTVMRLPLGFLLFVNLATPSLIAMLTYRALAGLEPAPLPEDLEVTDTRRLVGADHVRRRTARVVRIQD